jgi:hypothetical protein
VQAGTAAAVSIDAQHINAKTTRAVVATRVLRNSTSSRCGWFHRCYSPRRGGGAILQRPRARHNDYRIVVEGELGSRSTASFRPMELPAHDGTTEIAGRVEGAGVLSAQ